MEPEISLPCPQEPTAEPFSELDDPVHTLTPYFFAAISVLITESMGHSPSCEAHSHSANQEIPRLLWNKKFH
jgi:hypothetical protein